MGPSRRLGPAKDKALKKSIEETLSDAMTPDRSMFQKVEDYILDKASGARDTLYEYRASQKETQKFEAGGRVGQCAGDVRYSRNRGKTY